MARVQDIITSARDILADPTGTRWSDDALLRLLNEALIDFCSKSLILREQLDINVHAGQSNYTLPDNVYATTAFYLGNKELPQKSIDAVNLNSIPGTPTTILNDKLSYGLITLYPTPAEDAILTVYYIKIPSKVSLTDDIEIPLQYDKALKYYIAGQALRSDEDTLNRQYGLEELKLYEIELENARILSSKDFTRKIYTTQYRIGV